MATSYSLKNLITNMEILILLGIITAVELYRVWTMNKPLSKRAHFKSKLRGTKQMRWDREFQAVKTMGIREDLRKEYDHMQSIVDNFDKKIKNKMTEDENGSVKDQKTRAEADRDRLLGQMQQLDVEVNGTKPTEQYPEGHTGINQQIESLIEVEGMLKNHIKSL